MKVIVRAKADNDLDGIFAWIAKDDPTAAIRMVRHIRDQVDRLAVPGLEGIGHPGVVPGTYEIVELPYILVYKINPKRREIHVLAVFHCAQDR